MEDQEKITVEGFIKVFSVQWYVYAYAEINESMKLKDLCSQPHESMKLTNFLQKSMNI